MENKKINIAEILKDCPTGMELDCLMYDNLYFDEVDEDCRYPIGCYTIYDNCRTSVNFTKFGEFNNYGSAKCVIFPKGKTTWEGFVPPCKFKNGDVCYIKTKKLFEYIFIFKVNEDYNYIQKYVTLFGTHLYTDEIPVCTIDVVKEIRLATEEEKQKLFDAIKENDYKWNKETKTLEKLVKPRFKIGNRVKSKTNQYEYTIIDITKDGYIVCYKTDNVGYHVPFCDEDNFDLIHNKFDITTLKPFESKVLVRDNIDEVWLPCFFGGICNNDNNCLYNYPYRTVGGERWKCCIPYESNEHLLNKKDDCSEYYKNW